MNQISSNDTVCPWDSDKTTKILQKVWVLKQKRQKGRVENHGTLWKMSFEASKDKKWALKIVSFVVKVCFLKVLYELNKFWSCECCDYSMSFGASWSIRMHHFWLLKGSQDSFWNSWERTFFKASIMKNYQMCLPRCNTVSLPAKVIITKQPENYLSSNLLIFLLDGV